MDVSWTQNYDETFLRYEVHVSTEANFSLSEDTKVAEITEQSTTSYTVTGLNSLSTYYAKVTVLFTDETRIESNETSADTRADIIIEYTYDENSNRVEMKETKWPNIYITSYEYDPLNRLRKVADRLDKAIYYEYDGNGNRVKMIDPEGGITTYQYSGNNQLLSLSNPQGETTSYGYDRGGNQVLVNYHNGSYSTYIYNERNWLAELINHGSTISSFSYQHDLVGNRIRVTEADGSVLNYSYDSLYRLIREERSGSISYEASYTYSYDSNGNQISKARVNGSGAAQTTTYEWDFENRLISVSSPQGTTTYEYDGDGNRVSKTNSSGTINYINDINRPLVQVLMEKDGAGTLLATYTIGNDLISRHSATAEAPAQSQWYHYDGLGSVRQLTDSVASVVAEYVYDAWGNVLSSTDGTGNVYGFTGEQQFREGDGLIFLRARYYSPTTGRFMSVDPLWAGGVNLYVYVGNNPTNSLDPTGKQAEQQKCCPPGSARAGKPPLSKWDCVDNEVAYWFSASGIGQACREVVTICIAVCAGSFGTIPCDLCLLGTAVTCGGAAITSLTAAIEYCSHETGRCNPHTTVPVPVPAY